MREREVWLARLDKTRPAVVLTRPWISSGWPSVTLAPITSTRLGLVSEVVVGPEVGVDRESTVQCDAVTTVPRDRLLRRLGVLGTSHERLLRRALLDAWDLEPEDDRAGTWE